MTCTYDFWWRHIYVHLTIASGEDILGPEGPYISFPHNLTKKYFFSKVRIVSDSARRDLSEEPIKNWGLCKSALDLNWSSRNGPYHKVHYYKKYVRFVCIARYIQRDVQRKRTKKELAENFRTLNWRFLPLHSGTSSNYAQKNRISDKIYRLISVGELYALT